MEDKKRTAINMKNKVILGILAFLMLGMYVDVRMQGKDEGYCVEVWRQRMFIIQTVVPFRPQREVFYFGVGNRHYEHIEHTEIYLEKREDEKEVELAQRVRTWGCAPRWTEMVKRGRTSNFLDHAHYINLRPFSAVGYLEVEKTSEAYHWTKERYEDWYGGR